MRIAIAGTGRVATGLALALASRRGSVALSSIWSRRPAAARALARRCRIEVAAASPGAAIASADVLLLCVADDAIAAVAARFSRESGLRGKVVLHTSGALGPAPLRALRRAGASVGVVHPLAAFPRASSSAAAALFRRPIGFTIGGDAAATRAARRLVRRLGGFPVPAPANRAAYHAAAVMLANHVTVLAAAGLGLVGRRAAMRGPSVRRAFATLIRTAADGIERDGGLKALTGPAARGDVLTIRRHLAALSTERPEVRDLYRDLSREAARLSARRGSLSARALASILRALGSPSRRAR
ncbi:MAG: DUF2520 domain-containing protein [Acidobacteria bacterium]|nr:DUF2520 domain-containing protein [Acidobacteriota bacterium]